MKNASFTIPQVKLTVSLLLAFVVLFSPALMAQSNGYAPGVAQTGLYYNMLSGKRIAVVANATSLLPNGTHTVDHLISIGAEVHEVWAPEHGFRGDADAGEYVKDGRDPKTGIVIRSLYGKTKRPELSWLERVDFVVYDIQDVGIRFYTYSTTLSYVLDACIESGVPLLVLDRGNPNGHYVDGPVLHQGFESMVGLHPIPVVHGLTMGEYALMVYGERWVPFAEKEVLRAKFDRSGGLTVIPCKNYSHNKVFKEFQVSPSPNLRSIEAIWHYPSLCYFEGTPISCGRGTDAPFTRFGAPWLDGEQFPALFTPLPDGGAKYPKFESQECHGQQLSQKIDAPGDLINWQPLFSAYKFWETLSAPVENFFNPFFAKLSGSQDLQHALESGLTIAQWRESYQAELGAYLGKRSIYLLYK